jgi:excisionase family DNA binding protein
LTGLGARPHNNDMTVSAQQVTKGWINDAVTALPGMLTTDETAKFLHMSRRNLYRLISTGRLHAVKTATGTAGRVLVPRASLVSYLRGLDIAA